MSKKNIIILSFLAVLIAGAIFVWLTNPEKVVYTSLEVKDVQRTIAAEGIVDSSSKKNVVAAEDAMVLSVLKKKGDVVKIGDPIVELEISKREVLNQAMQSQLELLKTLLTELKDEAQAKAADPYIQLYEKAVLQYTEANAIYDNVVLLSAAGAVSTADIKEAALTLTEKSDRLNTAEDKLWNYIEQLDPTLYSKQRKTWEAVKKMYAVANGEQKRLIILAESDGVLTELFVEEGLMIRKKGLLFELADPSKLLIQADVEVLDAKDIKTGNKAEVSIGSGETVQMATVSKVAKAAIEKVGANGNVKKVIPVVCVFNESQVTATLKDKAKLIVTTGMAEKAVAVPKKLTVEREGKYFVYVNADGKLKELKLEVLLVGDDYIAVKKGFKVGDRIIKPDSKLKIGDRVQ